MLYVQVQYRTFQRMWSMITTTIFIFRSTFFVRGRLKTEGRTYDRAIIFVHTYASHSVTDTNVCMRVLYSQQRGLTFECQPLSLLSS